MVITVVFLLIFGFISQARLVNASNFLQYENQDRGISMFYPSDWEELGEPGLLEKLFMPIASEEIVTFVSPEEGENLYEVASLAVFENSYQESLEKFLNEEKQFIESYEDYELIDISYMYIDGRPAYELVYFADSLYNRLVLTVVGDSIYRIEYTGPKADYDRFYDDATGMIDSFKILNRDTTPVQGLSLESGCVDIHPILKKTEQDCHDMFDGNSVKSRGALFVACNIAKFVGARMHPLAGAVAFFIPC